MDQGQNEPDGDKPHDGAEPGQSADGAPTEPTEGSAASTGSGTSAPHAALHEPFRCDVVDGLSPMQAKAVIALLNEPSIAKAAAASGVGVRTLHNWLDTDEEFVAAYRKARRQTFAQAISLTMRYTPMAVNVLAKVMVDTAAPYAARVAAATNLLRFGRESIELDDLAVRVESLERLQNTDSPRLAFHRGQGGGGGGTPSTTGAGA